jgi:hypothetical protein
VVQWSEFLAADPEVRVRFPALPDFLSIGRSETGSIGLVITTGELLGRKNSGSGLERREYGRWDPSRRPHDTYMQELALPSPSIFSLSAGIVCSRSQATEFSFIFILFT